MAFEINYKNNLTIYTNGYAKITRFTDDTINRVVTINVAFFPDAKDSHSTSRIVFVDEMKFKGDEYKEMVEDYGEVNSQFARKIAYEKLFTEYTAKWTSVSNLQNIVDGIERPYRDEVLKVNTEKDDEFVVKGNDYKADPTPAKEAIAKEKLQDVVEHQREFNDVIYGEFNEYPDAPIEYSPNFEVALEQIP